jgi:nitroimidazol reductase NimA-like FMN-containing flavoprotein (pyridoxamine 5'-phosphate oxidase superfamily)
MAMGLAIYHEIPPFYYAFMASTYHMLRSEKEITDPAMIERILKAGRYASIALCDGEDPYVITLSYGYAPAEKALFFHTAKKGRKLDIIAKNPRACATVIEDRGYIQGKCNHAYSSVIVHGSIRSVTDEAEKIRALGIMIDHLESDPAPVKERLLAKRKRIEEAEILRLDIEEVHGRSGG